MELTHLVIYGEYQLVLTLIAATNFQKVGTWGYFIIV